MSMRIHTLLLLIPTIIIAGCGTHVFRAGFNEKSEGDSFPGSDVYIPPENPGGDRIIGANLTSQTHAFTTNQTLGYGTTLLLQPITPAANSNATLTFESTDVSSSHQKYTMAWSGRKKGNLVMNCNFGWATDTQSFPDVKYRFTLRFADGKLYVFNLNAQPEELGVLPNDVEHRVFVTARPNSNSYYVSVKNSSTGELSDSRSMGPADFEDTDNLRVQCAYDGTAPSGSNHYLFDKMEFKSRKS